jgi:ABC-2 type transport system permease protein
MIKLISKIYDFLLILKAEWKRDLIYMQRYPLEIISFLAFMYIILLAVFFGFTQLTVGNVNLLNKEKMIIGYCLMQFVLSTQMGWSGQIQNESQTGTLEQLSVSGHSLGEVLLARGLSQLPRQVISFLLLISMYKLSLTDLQVGFQNFFSIFIVLFVLAIGIFGISFIFAGITLLFKRVGFFFQIINFAFLGLFWQDRSKLESSIVLFIYDHFPLTQGMSILQKTLIKQYSEFNLFDLDLLSFMFSSILSLLIGYYLFSKMEEKARDFGLLSQY